MAPTRITAAEAATRLGVKRETIYAYVSRGLLESRRDIDGKSSTFDPEEIAGLRRGRRSARRGHLEVPITSAITEVTDGRVAYRGHRLAELISGRHPFESVASLLWSGELNPGALWPAPRRSARAARRAAGALGPAALPTDMMMAAVIAAASADPFRSDRSAVGVAAAGAAIVTTMIESLPELSPATDDGEPVARRLWRRLATTSEREWPLLDAAMVLLADHGMASSTLAARLAASTRSGVHPVVLAGLGTVVGPLHGGTSRLVHQMFADAAERGADTAIAEVLRRDDRIPGIGHLIHRTADPRHDLLFDALGRSSLDSSRADIVASVVARISERYDVAPNIDLALGAFTFMSGMNPDAGEVIFAIARTAGWIAHALEEYEEVPLRFRAVGRYSGPTESSS